MDRGSVLSGSAFSAVLQSAVAFLVVLIAVGFVTHSYVDRRITDELREDVQMRWSLYAVEYQTNGVSSVIKLIDTAVLFNSQGRIATGLFDIDGVPVAGNILSRPDATGWQQAPLSVFSVGAQSQVPLPKGLRAQSDYLYLLAPLDKHWLVIGYRLDNIVLINRAMVRTLAITGFFVVLIMLSVGYLFSYKSQLKLQMLEAALAQVSTGAEAERMPVSAENDQIDRIADRMNTHLDTLSRLMLSTRATAAAVAHDLKSPLARAYLSLGRALAQAEANKDPRAEIEATQAELEGMSRIFDTFLQLSSINAGADGAPFTQVDLGALLDDLAETYQMVAEDNGQSFIYDRSNGEKVQVVGNATMLQQMVVNLLQNAVTHGPKGNEICLTLERTTDHIRLTVADRGPGIPKAAREAVFEPFYRLDPSRSKRGSGLGLALVRAIAARHGARIALLDNAPGLRVVVEFDQPDAAKAAASPV